MFLSVSLEMIFLAILVCWYKMANLDLPWIAGTVGGIIILARQFNDVGINVYGMDHTSENLFPFFSCHA
jgi:hypothetical protein